MYKIINQNKTNQRTSLLISLFETNYLKAEELFPKKLNTHFFSFSLPEGNLNNNVSINRISFSSHTDLFIIKQSKFKTLGLKNIEIEVVIYHDAKMAEVTKFNKKRIPWFMNYYSKLSIYSKDEKLQWNLFLFEWLKFSLTSKLVIKSKKIVQLVRFQQKVEICNYVGELSS